MTTLRLSAPLCVAALAFLSNAIPSQAQGWSDVLPKGGIGCFVRDYDAAHLARNAGQSVESIRAVVTDSIAARQGDFPGAWLHLVIAYAVKGRAGEQWEQISCDAGPEGAETPIACKASCYGGSYDFKMAIAGRDSIRIDLGGAQTPFCRGDRALEHAQNRVFVLHRVAPERCALTGRRSP